MTKSSKLVFLLLTAFLLSAPILYSQNELIGANEDITESYQQLKDNEKSYYDSLVLIYKNNQQINRLDLLMDLLEICPGEDNVIYLPEATDIINAQMATAKDDSVKMIMTGYLAEIKLYEAAYQIQELADKEAGLISFEEELRLRKSIHDSAGAVRAYMRISNLYEDLGDYYGKLNLLKDAVQTFEKWEYLLGLGKMEYQLGMFYSDLGDFENSNRHIRIAQQVEQKIGDTSRITRGLYLIGNFYFQNSKIDSAIYYFERCSERAKKLGDNWNYIESNYRLAQILKDKNHLSEALLQLELVFDLTVQDKDYGLYYKVSMEMADCNLLLKDYHETERIYIDLLGLLERFNLAALMSQVRKEYAKLYFILGKYEKAQMIITPSLDWHIKMGRASETIDVLSISYKIDSAMGDYKQALEKHVQLVNLNELIENKDLLIREAKSSYLEKISEEEEKNRLAHLTKDIEISKKQADLEVKEKMQYFLYAGLGLALLFGGFIFNRFRVTNKQKAIIELQKQKVDDAYDGLEEAHKEITDSINYAERIQRSFLATDELLNENLNEYFVYFNPKEAVSGDFYWAGKLNNGNFAMVNADSTGHGVPGAIMSILNVSSIEKAVENNATSPDDIFNQTRKTIIERLKKDGSTEGGKDGMDASLISFNKDKTKMTYVAAQNPIWIIRDSNLTEIKPEKMPVGKHDNDHIPFNGGVYDIQKGDLIYTLTDGFQDQFGGPKGKKFMVKKMREYMLTISNLSMAEQHQRITDTFSNWKGDVEQVDDVCVIGVRI
jgi:serine phosphatase RsbU (regulator of sigma subunit)